jgi:hypothetical protein
METTEPYKFDLDHTREMLKRGPAREPGGAPVFEGSG